jgi:hypothetical protein
MEKEKEKEHIECLLIVNILSDNTMCTINNSTLSGENLYRHPRRGWSQIYKLYS